MTEQQPTVGRIVHYTSYGTPGGEYGKECRAAIVTEAGNSYGNISLAVLNPTGMFFNRDVPAEHIEDKIEPGPPGRSGGTWHWPERA